MRITTGRAMLAHNKYRHLKALEAQANEKLAALVAHPDTTPEQIAEVRAMLAVSRPRIKELEWQLKCKGVI